jgi:hypothetical protein
MTPNEGDLAADVCRDMPLGQGRSGLGRGDMLLGCVVRKECWGPCTDCLSHCAMCCAHEFLVY